MAWPFSFSSIVDSAFVYTHGLFLADPEACFWVIKSAAKFEVVKKGTLNRSKVVIDEEIEEAGEYILEGSCDYKILIHFRVTHCSARKIFWENKEELESQPKRANNALSRSFTLTNKQCPSRFKLTVYLKEKKAAARYSFSLKRVQHTSSISSTAVAPRPLSAPFVEGGLKYKRSRTVLGQGAVGRVFLGIDQENGNLIAVKQVDLNSKIFQTDALEAEIENMKKMDHPNIVRYLGMERTAKHINIFLEYVPGGSIQSLLKKFGSFSESVTQVYARQILLGLEYLHSNNMLHRDIKGGNILVDDKSCIKLSDFGSVKRIGYTQADGTKTITGTPSYMPKEVIREARYSVGSDIWSFGCTILEMLTGELPWSNYRNLNTPLAIMYHIANTDETPFIPDTLSRVTQDFLKRCFARNADDRPSATELLQHPFITEKITPPDNEDSDMSSVDCYTSAHDLDDTVDYENVDDACCTTETAAFDSEEEEEEEEYEESHDEYNYIVTSELSELSNNNNNSSSSSRSISITNTNSNSNNSNNNNNNLLEPSTPTTPRSPSRSFKSFLSKLGRHNGSINASSSAISIRNSNSNSSNSNSTNSSPSTSPTAGTAALLAGNNNRLLYRPLRRRSTAKSKATQLPPANEGVIMQAVKDKARRIASISKIDLREV